MKQTYRYYKMVTKDGISALFMKKGGRPKRGTLTARLLEMVEKKLLTKFNVDKWQDGERIITAIIDLDTDTIGIAVCKPTEQFSKKTGRFLAGVDLEYSKIYKEKADYKERRSAYICTYFNELHNNEADLKKTKEALKYLRNYINGVLKRL